MEMTITNQFQSAPKPLRPANYLGISFDISAIKGKFDPDVQDQCEAALASLKESQRLYQLAVGAVRDRNLQKLNAEWAEMQVAGRKLENKLKFKLSAAQGSANLFRSNENNLRSATLALNKAKAEKLPKRPTVQEIAKRDAAIANAEAVVAEARTAQAAHNTRHLKADGELKFAQDEYKTFEEKERDLANRIKSISGHFPDHYVVAGARNQQKEVSGNEFGIV